MCLQKGSKIKAKAGGFWDLVMKSSEALDKFQSSMGKGLKIALENGAKYELHSNTPIPQGIKEWLIEMGIKYTEWL